jgi:uncharacterized protein (DUF2384 family)
MLSSFLEGVSEPQLGGISPQRMSQVLHVALSQLSAITGLHRNTLTSNPGSPEVQQRLGTVAGMIATAAELIGDEQRAVSWFRHQPLSRFDHQTAEDLVTAGAADAVLTHLRMLADGGYA